MMLIFRISFWTHNKFPCTLHTDVSFAILNCISDAGAILCDETVQLFVHPHYSNLNVRFAELETQDYCVLEQAHNLS